MIFSLKRTTQSVKLAITAVLHVLVEELKPAQPVFQVIIEFLPHKITNAYANLVGMKLSITRVANYAIKHAKNVTGGC